MTNLLPDNYKETLVSIKQEIDNSRIEALRKVNSIQLTLYWKIGAIITQKKEEGKWGSSIVDKISDDLKFEYPGIRGFSPSNMWRMAKLFNGYRSSEKLAPLVLEIGWSQNIVIYEKCKDEQQREFYLRMVAKYGWTKNLLINQIESGAYEKYLLNQTNFDQTVPAKYKKQAILAVKDEYSFDFLDIGNKHSEKELEYELIKNIRKFLLEMGPDFSFIGSQYKVSTETKDYYIDLLLFHRTLKSLIALELKIGEFKPEYAGKMQFYLTLLDERLKNSDENPSIGIIICKNKDRTEVEYTLKRADAAIGVATYNIMKILPENMRKLLPSSDLIAEKLLAISE
ncbi:DUF1016 family protein, partial [bacterium]|nr:DUF1016 family protein [bacterium]